MTKYFHRSAKSVIAEALHEMPVVVLTGMRQTGKSTFLQKQPEIRNRRYITFDDFAQLESAKARPEDFVNTDEPITIDEAHKCPEILTAIKKKVDRERKPGQFLLSGSANFTILKNVSESLAGRAVYFTLHPFTRREISGHISDKPFLQEFCETHKIPKTKNIMPVKAKEVLKGGMPSVCLGEVKNSFLWFKGYEQTYLERDIREISQIGNIIPFRNILHLTAMRTGQLLSPSQLGRDAKMNVATTSRYLSNLEASFIIYRLAPYLKNRASRLIKSPKLYVTDSGLASFLCEIDTLDSQNFGGAVFETYVANNLSGIIDAEWPEAKLYFWNVQGRHEVDFVIEARNRAVALEVKTGTRWTERDLSGLKAFLSVTPHCSTAILAYNGTEAVKIGEKLWALPLSLVLS